jgi:hypothetical protein
VSSYSTGNQWYKNNVLIPGATSQKFNPTNTGSGSYTVKVRQSDCFSPFSDPFSVAALINESAASPGAASIAEIQAHQVVPNPARGRIYIQGLQGSVNVELFNSTGVRLLSKTITGEREAIDLSHLHPGIYLAFLRQDGKSVKVQKLILQ